ncbi:hypothetical protein JX266_000795 [Neoarthrinium moseri]|nr:hypothetical protein JX266_000795 [Neoarthrinium moseri]
MDNTARFGDERPVLEDWTSKYCQPTVANDHFQDDYAEANERAECAGHRIMITLNRSMQPHSETSAQVKYRPKLRRARVVGHEVVPVTQQESQRHQREGGRDQPMDQAAAL